MRLLTIDWDWAFPPSVHYDISHCENTFMIHMIWQTRCNCMNLNTNAHILDEYIPDQSKIKQLLDIIDIDYLKRIVVTESHMSLIKQFPVEVIDEIWNFDAHNDLWESSRNNIDCSNWADFLLQNLPIKYNVVFPEWEKLLKLNQLGLHTDEYTDRVTLHYDIPTELPKFDLLHICRSGAWTPSWSDDEFVKFVKNFSSAKICDDVLTCRSPDMTEAREIAEIFRKSLTVKYWKKG